MRLQLDTKIGSPSIRIGFTDRPPFETPVDEACATAVRETAALLASLGHDVEEAAPEIDGETIIGTLGGVWAADNARSVRAIERELGRKLGAGDLEETTWELVRYGSHLSGVDLLDALDALGAQEVQRFVARRRHGDGKAALREIVLHNFSDHHFVLDDQRMGFHGRCDTGSRTAGQAASNHSRDATNSVQRPPPAAIFSA